MRRRRRRLWLIPTPRYFAGDDRTYITVRARQPHPALYNTVRSTEKPNNGANSTFGGTGCRPHSSFFPGSEARWTPLIM